MKLQPTTRNQCQTRLLQRTVYPATRLAYLWPLNTLYYNFVSINESINEKCQCHYIKNITVNDTIFLLMMGRWDTLQHVDMIGQQT